ncbi:hypothetical protein [Streptomyces drozdowiczii]|uniref:hypothetical protein n=1 Tax=Streptomyces drozdowiczii TaxID=202862 RepID=UPI0035AB739B
MRHGHVQGRDFHLLLRLVERPGPTAGLATRWGWYPRTRAPGKTVWAEYEIPAARLG